MLNLNRSVFYYQAKGDSEATRFLIREIDKIYTEHPFFGARRIAAELGRRFPDQKITRKRVGRLMRKMGIEAVYPKPRLSIGNHEHCKYPYLLKGLEISRVNQVWGTDITYIPTLVNARTDLNAYFNFYNNHRPHQALEYRTPTEVYFNLGKGVPPPVAGLSFLKSAA